MAKKARKPIKSKTITITTPGAAKELKVVNVAKLPARPLSYVPEVVAHQGKKAQKRFLTFFTDQYRNKNTREAYHRNASQFFEWCQHRKLAFPDIESFHVSAYIEELLAAGRAKRTVKQHLATIRKLYDWLILGQICSINPAQAVNGPKISASKGTTPYLDEEAATEFLDSIDTSTIIGLRDKALIALMTYSFARIGAAVSMNIDDYYRIGKRWYVKLHEKGGKEHTMLAHRRLEECLDDYIEQAGGFDTFPEEDGSRKTTPPRPLFRTTRGRSGELTNRRMHRNDAWRMVKRRAADAGIRASIGNHTFRATGITNYMTNGGDLKYAKKMANHASEKTTGSYDHSEDAITLDELEKITIGRKPNPQDDT